ncbi:MAG: methionyl-tRNA formyltransferase [Candidatus Saccharimonadales bacterium]
MSKTIVFFGSGPVAAKSLKLLASDFDIEAVVTKPQPSHHKEAFPVIRVAEELNLQIYTANDRSELSDVFNSNSFDSELGVIIDHGIIISKDVIDRFPLGIINSHFSLLPRWRGPDPISFAILQGDAETGVSVMRIVEKLDEGDLLIQRKLAIDPDITTPELTEKLIGLSHSLLIESLPAYVNGDLMPYSQPQSPATYSHKLSKQDGIIDWNKPAETLEREVRAYYGWPRSRASLGQIDIIITKAHVDPESGTPGSIETDGKILVHCSKDSLVIDRLIPLGKKEMSSKEFLNGYKI